MTTVTRWGDLDVVSYYEPAGPSDAGEQVLWPTLLEAARGARVLDVGIGAGRTTTLLSPVAATYVGIDISEPLLAKARAAHPSTDLRVLDARALEALTDEGYDLVLWSLNGIDVLDHDERGRFLDETARLLRPGGLLIYSTHNLDGPSCHEVPWHPTRSRRHRPSWVIRTIRLVARHAAYYAHLPTLVLSCRNYASTRRLRMSGDGWARMPLRSHEFRFVCQFTRLGCSVAEVTARGFTVERVVTYSGADVPVDAGRYDDDFAHLVCRRNDDVAKHAEQGSASSA